MATKMKQVPPGLAWLFVFIPAAVYFLSTRLSSGFWSELGETVSTVQVLGPCEELSESTLYANCNTGELSYSLQNVQDTGLDGVVDMIWRHDSELGRGYLLLSESAGTGRIWRWEVGGGPIAIGKTLHVDASGCRSKQACNVADGSNGSGGMAIDFYGKEHASEGKLVVAEWGEGRIVRLEENGARTPLLMHVPCECKQTKCTLPNPERMAYTPTGGLIVVVNQNECGEGAKGANLIQLDYAVHVKALPSLKQSREAHAWTTTVNHNHSVTLLFSDPSVSRLGGIAVTANSLYMTGVQQGLDGVFSIVLLELSIEEEDDDEEDDGDIDEKKQGPKTAKEAKSIFNISSHARSTRTPGDLAVSKAGTIFVTVDDGVLILKGPSILGRIPVPDRPTAVVLGGDGYLYISSSSRLYRIRTKEKPVEIPTDRVARAPKTLS